jgi:peptidoglycan/LPS O-acetylase OafA/YrhL
VSLLLSLPFAFLVSGSNGYDEATIENYISSALMLNPMLLNGLLGTELNYPFQILWTISVELTFYFAIAILFFSLRRRNTQLLIWILLISCVSILLKLSNLSQFPIRGIALALGTVYFPYFLFGCAVSLIRTRMGSLHALVPIAFASLLLAIISTDQPDNEFHRGFVISGIALMFSLFIASDSHTQKFSFKSLESIGDYSYEIYLVHGIVILPVLGYLAPPPEYLIA